MLDGNVLLRQKRDEVPEGTLSCPDRNLAVFHHDRHYEGLRLLLSVCDSKLIQQTLISVVVCHVLLMDLYSFHDIWDSPLMKFVSSYQMPLFMFLSGLVSITTNPKNGIIHDIIKRIQQLIVPFIIVASIFSLWKEHSLGFIFDTFKWGYWYLWVLFTYYLFSYTLNGGEIYGLDI